MNLTLRSGLTALCLCLGSAAAFAQAAAPAEPAAAPAASAPDPAKVQAYAAKLTTDWQPMSCPRPTRPQFTIRDEKSYKAAAAVAQKHLDALNAYMKCINEDATADLTAYQAHVQDGMNKIANGLQTEATGINGELQDAVNRLNKQAR